MFLLFSNSIIQNIYGLKKDLVNFVYFKDKFKKTFLKKVFYNNLKILNSF
jgi:hypothetical protein